MSECNNNQLRLRILIAVQFFKDNFSIVNASMIDTLIAGGEPSS